MNSPLSLEQIKQHTRNMVVENLTDGIIVNKNRLSVSPAQIKSALGLLDAELPEKLERGFTLVTGIHQPGASMYWNAPQGTSPRPPAFPPAWPFSLQVPLAGPGVTTMIWVGIFPTDGAGLLIEYIPIPYIQSPEQNFQHLVHILNRSVDNGDLEGGFGFRK